MIKTVSQKIFKTIKLNIKILIKSNFVFLFIKFNFHKQNNSKQVQLMTAKLNVHHQKQHTKMSFLFFCTEGCILVDFLCTRTRMF